MKYLKYIFNKFHLIIYIFAAVVFSLVLTAIANKFDIRHNIELSILGTILIFIIRISDDISDYTSDKTKHKIQYLSLKELNTAKIISVFIFALLNVLFYGGFGILSALVVLIIAIWENINILKILLLPALTVYYLFLLGGTEMITVDYIWFIVFIATVISYLFYSIKGSKREA